ncbi:MAG: LPS export ABC transporter ATP-binding protein [Candidatus Aminicenantes bacterium]|nr:LPS export ABC transporter ATP-binding protein [Candidatus Aminicenantes bacterium]
MKSSLRASHLSKSYRGKKVVDDVSLEIRRGEIVGLLGPNGAGKTTTFSMILGLVPRDDGRIFLDDADISEDPMYLRARKGICLLPQEPSSFRRLTVDDNLLAAVRPSARRREDADRTLEEYGLTALARAKAYTLSGGERRRLEIARAMMSDPDFVLLDEPFTGIDPLAIQDLQRIVRSMKDDGLGVLITDHNVRDTLRIVDRAAILDRGRIVEEGPPEAVVASPDVRRRYLGDDFSL